LLDRRVRLEIIWAPWRLSYVSKVGKGNDKECFICKAAREHPEGDEKNLLLFKGKKALVILNRYPYNTGHLMVCPIRHTGDFLSLLPEEILEINELLKRALKTLKRVYNPDGFNVGLNLGKASGGSVDTHIHYHVIPRWVGDTNFLPVTAGVKVIPQALEETFKALKNAWD
jgi:ATP adenylyltransferase